MKRAILYALGLLVEEMGETLQIIGKAMRFGLDAPGPDREPYRGRSARQLLPIELGDLDAARQYASEVGFFDVDVFYRRSGEKLTRLLDPDSVDTSGNRLAPDPDEEETVTMHLTEEEALAMGFTDAEIAAARRGEVIRGRRT